MGAGLKPCWQPSCRTPRRLRRHKAPHFLHLITEDNGCNREKRKAIRPTALHTRAEPRKAEPEECQRSADAITKASTISAVGLTTATDCAKAITFQSRSICMRGTTRFAILEEGYWRPPVGLVCIYPAKISQLVSHHILTSMQGLCKAPSIYPSTRPSITSNRFLGKHTLKEHKVIAHRVITKP